MHSLESSDCRVEREREREWERRRVRERERERERESARTKRMCGVSVASLELVKPPVDFRAQPGARKERNERGSLTLEFDEATRVCTLCV